MHNTKSYFFILFIVVSFTASIYLGNGMRSSIGSTNICTSSGELEGSGMSSGGCGGSSATAVPTATPPTVSSTNPVNEATGVAINRKIAVTFSEEMNPTTITTSTFQVTGPGPTPVSGIVALDSTNQIASFTPTTNFASDTLFTATITSGAMDLAGNALAVNDVWTFTTGSTVCTTPPPVSRLGTASSFGVYGGSAGMTNTGIQTQINDGNIGTIATGTSSVTGFHDSAGDIYTETLANIGAVSGKIYTCTNSTTGPTSGGPNAASCATATQARLDAETAYQALVAMPAGSDPGSGQLGGLTLVPGVYTALSGSFLLTGTDLTLDAQGNSNAIFVFQMASSLTVGGPGAPRSVNLVNGALADNVYWQVGSAATINGAGGGTMVGTIISQAGVTFSTFGNTTITTLNGRALSLIASVTLVDSVVNVPLP